MKRRHRLLISLCILLIATPVWLVARQMRQERLDADLLRAVKANDTQRAVSLLSQGANADAREFPVDTRSFWQHLFNLFRTGRPIPRVSTVTPLGILINHLHPHNPYPVEPYRENIVLFEALLRHGADPNQSVGSVPLLIDALNLNGPAYVRLLVDYGADVNYRNKNGFTTLMWSVLASTDSTSILLERGAEINARDKEEKTALMLASSLYRPSTVRLLLNHEADVHLSDKYGKTALDYAQKAGNAKSTALLKKAGAKAGKP
jgi:ankyrin repeat protein